MRRRARSILAVGALAAGRSGARARRPGAAAAVRRSPTRTTSRSSAPRSPRQQVPAAARGRPGRSRTRRAGARRRAPRTVEVYLTDQQAGEAGGAGRRAHRAHALRQGREPRRRPPATACSARTAASGGLQEEILATGQANPGLTKVVSIGKTVNGQDILALKLTKGAKKTKDGSKPSVLYMSNQHAREWITPGDDPAADALLPGQLRQGPARSRRSSTPPSCGSSCPPTPTATTTPSRPPTTACGARTCATSTATARSPPATASTSTATSPTSGATTTRVRPRTPPARPTAAPAPASEPETKALDAFEKRIGFTYGINYHSAAELLLYGVGWQVATATPDDVALQGARRHPGELRDPRLPPAGLLGAVHHQRRGRRPRGQRQRHGDVHPGDVDLPDRVRRSTRTTPGTRPTAPSVFNFPDDEKLIQQEFAKNVPFALSVAETAAHPDQPTSSVGLDRRPTSPRTPSPPPTRAAPTRRSPSSSASPCATRSSSTASTAAVRTTEALRPWKGGETYGGEDNLYFDEYRAKVEDARPGRQGRGLVHRPRRRAASRPPATHFTYTVAERPRADTLVVAEEGATATAGADATSTR